jgi:DNA helicase TIP49 (TBP-interacting protein)
MSQHSHISSLGLTETGALSADSTIIGQEEARTGLGIVADLVRGKTFAGQAVLLAGT